MDGRCFVFRVIYTPCFSTINRRQVIGPSLLVSENYKPMKRVLMSPYRSSIDPFLLLRTINCVSSLLVVIISIPTVTGNPMDYGSVSILPPYSSPCFAWTDFRSGRRPTPSRLSVCLLLPEVFEFHRMCVCVKF